MRIWQVKRMPIPKVHIQRGRFQTKKFQSGTGLNISIFHGCNIKNHVQSWKYSDTENHSPAGHGLI